MRVLTQGCVPHASSDPPVELLRAKKRRTSEQTPEARSQEGVLSSRSVSTRSPMTSEMCDLCQNGNRDSHVPALLCKDWPLPHTLHGVSSEKEVARPFVLFCILVCVCVCCIYVPVCVSVCICTCMCTSVTVCVWYMYVPLCVCV